MEKERGGEVTMEGREDMGRQTHRHKRKCVRKRDRRKRGDRKEDNQLE